MNVQAPFHRLKCPLSLNKKRKYTLRCGMSGKINRKKRRIFEDDAYKMMIPNVANTHNKHTFVPTLH